MTNRVSVETYLDVHHRLVTLGYGREIAWAEEVKFPADAEAFANEAIWVICCSGFREQAARVTQRNVIHALGAGGSATEAFPKSGKGRAIDKIWLSQHDLYSALKWRVEAPWGVEALIGWISDNLPFVGGPILRYHFAKNIGLDVAKPDRWLCRLAGVPEDERTHVTFVTAMNLCRPIATYTGHRIATVDLVLWRACNLGILGVDATGGVVLNLEAGEPA